MRIEPIGASARGLFQGIPINQNGMPGDPGPGNVELVTTSIDPGCDGPGTWGGTVVLNYGGSATDLVVQLTSITDFLGHEPVNSDGAFMALDPTFGLWTYPASGASRQWCFNDVGAPAWTFTGLAFGDVPDAYPATVLADNPIAYYRLDEAMGATAFDSSGNGRHGSFTGGPDFGAAGALAAPTAATHWDGSSFMVTPALPFQPDLTAEVWGRSDASVWNTFGWLGSARGANGFIIHPAPGSSTVNYYVVNSSGVFTFVGNVVPADITAWHHYVLTYDNATGATVGYLDGQSVFSVSIAAGLRNTTPSAVHAGFDNCCGGTRFGLGATDELAIYGTVLSPARVLAHYNAGITP